MSSAGPLELVACADCGASNASTAAKCWLCGRTFGAATAQPSQSSSPSPPSLPLLPAGASPFSAAGASTEERRGAWTMTLSSIFIFITLIAVGLGLAQVEPGLAIWYALIVGPAYTATAITTLTRRAKGRPMTRGQQLTVFGIATGITLIAIPCLAVAALAAFFVYCLVALGR